MSHVASFSIFNSTNEWKKQKEDERHDSSNNGMGANFLLSWRLLLFFSSLFSAPRILFCRCPSLRSRYSVFISPLYGFGGMQPCVYYFHFDSIGVRSPALGNFGELTFRYRHFPFVSVYIFRFVRLSLCFCVEQPTMRACVSLCVWVLKHCLGYFYGSQYTFTSRMTVEIERLRQNEAWIFHLNFVFVSTNDDSLEFNSILMGDTGHKRILPFFLCKIDFLFESNGCNGFEFLNWKSPEEKQQSASC